jgi:hypothetical protein
LEFQLDEKDQAYEKKLRTLRQESERIKETYDSKRTDNKRVQELEKELETTKAYYNKRIREIEEKKGLKGADKKAMGKPPVQQKDDKDDQIEKLTKERNLLAQKVVNLESQNNKRR